MQKKSTVGQLILTEFKSSFEKGECPICEIISDHLERFYSWFVIESYYNPGMMDELKKAYGFCKEHTWKLIEAGRPYITGVMYEYITHTAELNLEQFLKEIRMLGPKRKSLLKREDERKDFKKMTGIFTQRFQCPACKNLAENERDAVLHFLMVLKEEGMKDLYVKSKGLCLHHLLQVLSISKEAEAIFLIEDQIERTQRLNGELREFLKKFDYRYQNEPKGPEQDSWIRAAKFFVGKRFDPLALIKRLEEGHSLKATASKGGARCC